MVKTRSPIVPDAAIHLINSLGGPPLPTGIPASALRVLMENRASADAGLSGCRVASALALHRA